MRRSSCLASSDVEGARRPRARLGAAAAAALVASLIAAAPAFPVAQHPDVGVDDAGDARFSARQSLGSLSLAVERGFVGSTLGPGQVLSLTDGSIQFPRVAVAPDGTATFVWEQNLSPFGAQARRRFPDGSLGPVHQLAGQIETGGSSTRVAVDAAGNATFVWVKPDAQGDRIVQTRMLKADGTLTSAQGVSAAGQSAGEAELAAAPGGDVVFVWRRSDGANNRIQTRRRAAAGGFSAVQDLSAAGQNAGSPSVAVDDDGDATFAWTSLTPQIVQTRRRTAAGTLSAVRDLSAAGQNAFFPAVAVDPDDDAAFAWQRSNGTNTVIQARARAADDTLTSTQNLSTAGQNAFNSVVGMDDAGNATFGWVRSNGTNVLAQTRRRNAAGTFTTAQNLSATGGNASDLRLAVAPTGDAVFAWARSDVVQGRRVGAGGGLGPIRDVAD
jgi:hypothetical protein